MVKYSIIVPVFNIEDWLANCIESVLKQNYKNFEVILIDDGSTDRSGKICDEYKKKDSRVKVIHQENRGLSGARNTGIKMAKGKYLIWLDGDDLLPERAIECLDKLLTEQGDADIIFHQRQLYFEKTKELKNCDYIYDKEYEQQNIEKVFQYLYDGLKYTDGVWTITINRNFLLEHELYFKEGIKHEDSLWSPIAIMNAKRVLFNNNNFYVYRVDRDGSIMNTIKINNLFDRITVIDDLLEESKKEKYSKKQKKLYEQLCGKMVIGLLTDIGYFAKESAEEYKCLVKLIKQRIWVLWTRREPRYRVIYILCKLVGVKKVNQLLQLKKSYEKKQ